jgi:iron complex outermembrane recepter protein
MKKHFIYFVALSLFGGSLFAQTKSITDSTYAIQEVQVIGNTQKKASVSKLSIPLHYLPLSVSSVSSSTLEMKSITNIQDAIRLIPGATIRSSYGAYQQMQVRGFDYTPIMIDGVRDERTSINNSAPFPDLSSVESIELLKGPSSVLYGHSAAGGILNVVRKAPAAKQILKTLLSYGSWDNKRAMMDFGGNLAGPLNYRAVINWSDVEGYRYTNDKRFSGYLALGAKLSPSQEIELRGGFNRDWYGTEIGLPRLMSNDIYTLDGEKYLGKGDMLPGLNKRWRYNNQSDFMINNGSNLMLRYSRTFSDKFKIENRLAYNYDNIDYFSTEELSYRESSSAIYPYYYLNNGNKQYISLDSVQLTYPLRFAYTVNVINEQFEASGRIQLPYGIKYNYLAGYNFVYFSRDTYRGYGGTNPDTQKSYTLSDLIDGPGLYSVVSSYNPHSMGYMDPYFGSGTSNRNYTNGVYLQNLLEMSKKFKLMLAGRFDTYLFKTATISFDKTKERVKYKDVDYSKTNSSAFTYRVGGVYLPKENLSVYGSFSNFFTPYRDVVSPTIIYIDQNGNRIYPTDNGEAFKPQTGYQGELGARYSLGTRLQVTACVYYIRRNNEKKTLKTGVVEDGVTKSVVGIIGSTESKGLELELTANPFAGMRINAGYSFTDASILNLKKNDYLNEDPQKGIHLAGVPMNTLFTIANYDFRKGLLRRTSVFASVTYTDHIYRDISKTVIFPSYWLTDMGISHKLKNGIQLKMNVNNVFNHYYFNQSLSTQIVPGLPRNYLMTVSYSM